jgi:carbon-monoxide dehydrogenase small subunit
MDVTAGELVGISLKVNGMSRQVEVEPRWLLADVLRHELGLTGTHVGCGHGVCGNCTVLVDGRPARSCVMLAVQAQGSEVQTVEALSAKDEQMHPLQEAFQTHHALQCGYCTPGFLMNALPIYREAAGMSDAEIREAIGGQICRCTGYVGIVEAVRAASRIEADRGGGS